MVMINRATKEITIKIVYYGPGLCGKTTNLEYVYSSANPERKGKLLTVATETDRTLFFDFLPVELGTIRGMKVRVQLYTVPGQVFYDATRRIVLRGSDGVVFVADSQKIMMDANLESIENLKTNLSLNTLDPEAIPLVFQYNKQDLSDLSEVEELEEKLNWRGVPHFLSVATVGKGVNETLREAITAVIKSLHGKNVVLEPAKDQEPAEAPQDEGEEGPSGMEESVAPPASEPGEEPPGEGAEAPGAEEAPPEEAEEEEEETAPPQSPMESTAISPPREKEGEVVEIGASEIVTVVAGEDSEDDQDAVEFLDLDAVDENDAPPLLESIEEVEAEEGSAPQDQTGSLSIEVEPPETRGEEEALEPALPEDGGGPAEEALEPAPPKDGGGPAVEEEEADEEASVPETVKVYEELKGEIARVRSALEEQTLNLEALLREAKGLADRLAEIEAEEKGS